MYIAFVEGGQVGKNYVVIPDSSGGSGSPGPQGNQGITGTQGLQGITGGSLPSGTAGQTLFTDGTTPAFGSAVEVYTGFSPRATGIGSTVLNGPGGGIASGIQSHSDSLGSAYGDYSHSSTGGTSYGAYSSSESASYSYGYSSHSETTAIAVGDSCHAEGSLTLAGAPLYNCTLATVSSVTVATITAVDVSSKFTVASLAWIYNASVSGTIATVAYIGGNTVITFTTTLTGAPTGADQIFEPDTVTNAHAEGSATIASGTASHSGGIGAIADLDAKWARGDTNTWTTEGIGRSQSSILILSARTADATPTNLTIGGGNGGIGLPLIAQNTTYAFTASIVGRKINGVDHVYWIRKGLIHNESGTVSLAGIVTSLGTDTGTTAGLLWGLAITADNTGKALQVQVTGTLSTIIHWTCKLECVEVG